MTEYITHHMGDGYASPCGLEPAAVYRGFQGAFSTDWADVDCPACLTKRPAGVGAPTPQLQKFYLTFGVQYSHTPHPTWPGANPDGWVLIEAVTESRARGLAYLYFKEYWSMLTPEAHFPAELNKARYYPLGEIARLRVGHSSIMVDSRLTIDGKAVSCPKFAVPATASDPLWYGVFDHEVMACRIEGKAKPEYVRHTSDSYEELGYDAMIVHPHCYDAAARRFSAITEVDRQVQAGELDWADPQECDVCGVSIT